MPLTIEKIENNSSTSKIGLKQGDQIISINGHSINDFLDLQYFGAEDELLINFTKGGVKQTKLIHRAWDVALGIIPEEHKCRTCVNNCLFCFIDQMHPKLRKSLYVKDDDFLYSFVYGNFITLTNLSPADYQKIFNQHISPLYISVHTTNPVLHRKMMKYKVPNFDILEKLELLSANEIDFYTQIVVVPGFNDGKELKKTLKDLTTPNLNTLSIGVVPVGLTKFRSRLKEVNRIDKTMAKDILAITRNFPRTFCSDELYILAGEDIPPFDFYLEADQLENGIGMLSYLLSNWESEQNKYIRQFEEIDKNPVFVTGKLAFSSLKKISDELNEKSGLNSRVVMVENDFFGRSVTVTGLLTAQDIMLQVQIDDSEIICLCNSIFNSDELTLDGKGYPDFLKKFEGKLLTMNDFFEEWNIIELVNDVEYKITPLI